MWRTIISLTGLVLVVVGILGLTLTTLDVPSIGAMVVGVVMFFGGVFAGEDAPGIYPG